MSYRYGLVAFATIATLGFTNAPAFAKTATPSFAIQSTSDTYTRLGYKAYQKGNYEKAGHYATKASAKGNQKSRRAIAYTLLCASLGQQNAFEAALEACDSAIELSPSNWRAVNNRGVVNYLTGDKTAAAADFAAAAALPDAALAQANVDTLASVKLVSAD